MNDLISRQTLIDAFKEEFYYMYSDDFNYMIKWFKNLPAASSSEVCDQLWQIAYERGKAEAHPKKVEFYFAQMFPEEYEKTLRQMQEDTEKEFKYDG